MTRASSFAVIRKWEAFHTGLAVPQQDCLGRLVPDAEPLGCRIRDPAVALHSDDLVGRLGATLRRVRMQLVQGFTADPARPAVLEEQDGTLERLGNGRLEHIESEIWVRFDVFMGNT